MLARLKIIALLLLLAWPAAGQVTQRYGVDGYSKLGLARNGIFKPPPPAGGTPSTSKGGQLLLDGAQGPYFGNSGTVFAGFAWTNAAGSYTLTRVYGQYGAFNGVGPGTMSGKIYASASGIPTGSALATSLNTIAISSMTTGVQNTNTPFSFNFSGLAVTPGNYAFVIALNGTGDVNNDVYTSYKNTSGAANIYVSATGLNGSWSVGHSFSGMYFEVFGF